MNFEFCFSSHHHFFTSVFYQQILQHGGHRGRWPHRHQVIDGEGETEKAGQAESGHRVAKEAPEVGGHRVPPVVPFLEQRAEHQADGQRDQVQVVGCSQGQQSFLEVFLISTFRNVPTGLH